jgi:hypothetical protein
MVLVEIGYDIVGVAPQSEPVGYAVNNRLTKKVHQPGQTRYGLIRLKIPGGVIHCTDPLVYLIVTRRLSNTLDELPRFIFRHTAAQQCAGQRQRSILS